MGRAWNQRMHQVGAQLAVDEGQAEKNRFKQNFFWLTLSSDEDLAI